MFSRPPTAGSQQYITVPWHVYTLRVWNFTISFFDVCRCSRGHPQPDLSNTLLFPGMYTHFEFGISQYRFLMFVGVLEATHSRISAIHYCSLACVHTSSMEFHNIVFLMFVGVLEATHSRISAIHYCSLACIHTLSWSRVFEMNMTRVIKSF